MEQRDYILREIEKISILLLGILGKMVRNKEHPGGVHDNGPVAIGRLLKEEALLDLDQLLQLPPGRFQEVLTRNRGFDETNIELLADVLAEIYLAPEEELNRKVKEKALELYRYAGQMNRVFSLDRQAKINRLEQELEA